MHAPAVRVEFSLVASRSDQEVRSMLSVILPDKERVDHLPQEVQRVPQLECPVHRVRQFWPVA